MPNCTIWLFFIYGKAVLASLGMKVLLFGNFYPSTSCLRTSMSLQSSTTIMSESPNRLQLLKPGHLVVDGYWQTCFRY